MAAVPFSLSLDCDPPPSPLPSLSKLSVNTTLVYDCARLSAARRSLFKCAQLYTGEPNGVEFGCAIRGLALIASCFTV